MQEQFRKIVNELGLEVVECRTNRNGRGLGATVQTDLYVRDSSVTVNVKRIEAATATGSSSHGMISRLVSAFLAQTYISIQPASLPFTSTVFSMDLCVSPPTMEQKSLCKCGTHGKSMLLGI